MLIKIASARFKSPPTPKQVQELEAITNAELLEDLGVRVLTVSTWSELMESPETPRPRRRKKS